MCSRRCELYYTQLLAAKCAHRLLSTTWPRHSAVPGFRLFDNIIKFVDVIYRLCDTLMIDSHGSCMSPDVNVRTHKRASRKLWNVVELNHNMYDTFKR